MVNRFSVLCCLFCLLLNTSQAADFIASVDRKELTIDEKLVLTLALFSSDTRLRAQGMNPNIDVTLLADSFDIGTPRNKTNYNIFRTQGRATSSLEIELFPKTTGNLTIPSFNVDGLTTQAISIKVLPSEYGNAPLAFSRSGVNQDSVWQGQQLVIFHDTYYRVELESAKLGGNIELEPQHLELFEHYRLPASERTEQHQGFTYKVLRNSWSLFPSNSGELTINLPDTWLVTADKKQLRLPHTSLNVEVKTLPSPVDTTALIGEAKISAEPITQSTHSGELNSWRIKITAPTMFTSLPASLDVSAPEGLRLFVDNKRDDRQDTAEGVTQIAYYTLSAIAQNPGAFQLPAIELNYFDTDSAAIKTASLTLPTLHVQQGTVAAPKTSESKTSSTINYNSTNNTPWIITTLLFASLWLTTMYHFRNKRNNNPEKAPPTDSLHDPIHISSRPLEAQLLKAFSSRSLEQGLNAWTQRHGENKHVSDIVRKVQSHYYGPAENTALNNLELEVNACCQIITSKSSTKEKTTTSWQAEAFTRSTSS